jgi:ribosomal protein L7/L12
MTTHDLILIGAAALAAFIGAKVASSGKADAARLAQLEKKVDQLLSQAGPDTNAYLQSSVGNPPNAFSASVSITGAASADIMDLIRRGRKIEAIKLYREQTGVGLKEAKDAVEQIERSTG